jgi:hypothetical protein
MRITLWGGFHNTAPVKINADVIFDGDGITAWISPLQRLKLSRAFCGISSCGCGGPRRAQYLLPQGWRFSGLSNAGFEFDSMIAYKGE